MPHLYSVRRRKEEEGQVRVGTWRRMQRGGAWKGGGREQGKEGRDVPFDGRVGGLTVPILLHVEGRALVLDDDGVAHVDVVDAVPGHQGCQRQRDRVAFHVRVDDPCSEATGQLVQVVVVGQTGAAEGDAPHVDARGQQRVAVFQQRQARHGTA